MQQTGVTESKKTATEEKQVDDFFIFCYRARYRVTEDWVRGVDLATVKKDCIDYCQRFGLTFISVRPAFLDLSKGIRNQQLIQEEEGK